MKRKDEREARRWVRRHFADLIGQCDCPMDDVPEAVLEVWRDETLRIAARLDPKRWSS